MKKILAALAACFIVALTLSPAEAVNRTQALHGMNPPSAWLNQEQRDVRIGFGQLLYDMLGRNPAGFYSNCTVSPVTGLYVAVGPSAVNTICSLYQYLAEETTAYGGYPSGTGSDALPADSTKVFLQGLAFTNGANIGPLSAPATSGQSINYLIECQVTTADQTSQSINVVSSSGIVTGTTANRDRNDLVTCQSRAGAAATTGSQVTPSTDTGYVAVAVVAVPYGTTSITTSMVTASNPFNGFQQPNIYNLNGVLSTAHIVSLFSNTLTNVPAASTTTGSSVITLPAAAAFTSTSTYGCTVTLNGPVPGGWVGVTWNVVNNSATQFTVTGQSSTGSGLSAISNISYSAICIGT